MEELKTIDVFCNSCNVLVAAGVVKVHSIGDSIGECLNEDTPYKEDEYTISLCGRCKSVFFIKSTYFVIPEPGIRQPDPEVQLLYPSIHKLDMNGVPATIVQIYSEALKCFRGGAYTSCLVMIRKCVEAICKELGATRGGLQKRLKALEETDKIDGKLLVWADGLRLSGNYAAHDTNANFAKSHARDALDFMDAILMYVFTLDRKFEEFQTRHKESREISD